MYPTSKTQVCNYETPIRQQGLGKTQVVIYITSSRWYPHTLTPQLVLVQILCLDVWNFSMWLSSLCTWCKLFEIWRLIYLIVDPTFALKVAIKEFLTLSTSLPTLARRLIIFFIYNNFAYTVHGCTNSIMLIQVWTRCYNYSTHIYM